MGLAFAREISLLVTKQAREKTVSLLSTRSVCMYPIHYEPCRKDELANVIKDTGGARGMKQSVLVSASEVMRYESMTKLARGKTAMRCVPYQLWALLER
ncbi:hypothetical protein ElyMa_005739400 [Elysia marginata]|uniref:Uncharacterized protein n=1 Tax=Elysia marginata TaxID=1093978 RepID=A0AAV4FNA7_9GAST|nr:hypothetical protein ElyMa_005739400 [Elysia marginata]